MKIAILTLIITFLINLAWTNLVFAEPKWELRCYACGANEPAQDRMYLATNIKTHQVRYFTQFEVDANPKLFKKSEKLIQWEKARAMRIGECVYSFQRKKQGS